MDEGSPPSTDTVSIRLPAMVIVLVFAVVSIWTLWANPIIRSGVEPGLTGYVININTADRDELCLLPRVGKGIARNIIDYRDTYGPFESTEQLMDVRFIGEKTFIRMRDFVTVQSAIQP